MHTTNDVLNKMEESECEPVQKIAQVLRSVPPAIINNVAEDLLGFMLSLHQAKDSE
jgi:hypothetical protein